MGYSPFYFDPMYFVFILPAALLAMYAQYRVKSAYTKWAQVRNSRNLTGHEVASVLLPREQLQNVALEQSPGELSDHYDPAQNILRLSPAVASQPTIASMSITAHELGHAEQDRDGYIWMKLRSGIVPFIGIGSTIGYLVFIGGLMMQINALAWIGVLMVSGGAIFALVTLPVEMNASVRAMRMLNENGLIQNEEERRASRDMLSAAALTYVAAAAQALSVILYYVFILMGNNRRRSDY
jgi:Zn-dependent membrane protease YugP